MDFLVAHKERRMVQPAPRASKRVEMELNVVRNTGGLNEIPHSLKHLSTWYLVDGMTLQEEIHHQRVVFRDWRPKSLLVPSVLCLQSELYELLASCFCSYDHAGICSHVSLQ